MEKDFISNKTQCWKR